MDIDNDTLKLTAPRIQSHWRWIPFVVNWIVDQAQDDKKTAMYEVLPFIFGLPTIVQQRNELTRRILRILTDPGSIRPEQSAEENIGRYWLGVLADQTSVVNQMSHFEDEDLLQDLCRQLDGVKINH